jgi:transposase
VGPITALTWALEIGDYTRFQTVKEAISYCGLCSAEKSSADKVMRMPISKQRNKHIEHVLVIAVIVTIYPAGLSARLPALWR